MNFLPKTQKIAKLYQIKTSGKMENDKYTRLAVVENQFAKYCAEHCKEGDSEIKQAFCRFASTMIGQIQLVPGRVFGWYWELIGTKGKTVGNFYLTQSRCFNALKKLLVPLLYERIQADLIGVTTSRKYGRPAILNVPK